MGSIGPGELLIIALIALLLFGAGRIADIGKGLGQGIKNFKEGLKEGDDEPKRLAEKSAVTVAAQTAPTAPAEKKEKEA
jgi:sec-independent protein translocase protein TatA